MKTTALEAYKRAIKAKYEVEKNGIYSSFFIGPSRAKLRDLCWEVFKENTNQDDLKSFGFFLKFEFSSANRDKLLGEKDKFRPIEKFFKGESDLTDLEAVNMAAILVDFQPRPFLKYSRSFEPREERETKQTESVKIEQEELSGTLVLEPRDTTNTGSQVVTVQEPPKPITTIIKKQFYLIVVILIGSGLFAVSKSELFSAKKDCMEWRGDHYEGVDCSSETLGIVNTKVPMDVQQFKLRKLKPSEARKIYYSKKKPGVWYEKTNGKVEFFNGPGYHPENLEYLKVATDLMINKYTE